MYFTLHDVCFKGCTLIVPSVSVGNVGQLTADLLISSLSFKKTGYFLSEGILPFVSADPYSLNSTSLALAAEVYHSEEHKIVIIQIRSSIAKGCMDEFLQALMQFVSTKFIERVVVLTGSTSEECIDEQIKGEPFRYLMCSQSTEKYGSIFRDLNWIALEQRFRFPAMAVTERVDEGSQGKYIIPGGGFGRRLFKTCVENKIPCIVLIKFCSEGDNIPDAMLVARNLNKWLNLMKDDSNAKWTFPPSWTHLFGNPPPRELY